MKRSDSASPRCLSSSVPLEPKRCGVLGYLTNSSCGPAHDRPPLRRTPHPGSASDEHPGPTGWNRSASSFSVIRTRAGLAQSSAIRRAGGMPVRKVPRFDTLSPAQVHAPGHRLGLRSSASGFPPARTGSRSPQPPAMIATDRRTKEAAWPTTGRSPIPRTWLSSASSGSSGRSADPDRLARRGRWRMAIPGREPGRNRGGVPRLPPSHDADRPRHPRTRRPTPRLGGPACQPRRALAGAPPCPGKTESGSSSRTSRSSAGMSSSSPRTTRGQRSPTASACREARTPRDHRPRTRSGRDAPDDQPDRRGGEEGAVLADGEAVSASSTATTCDSSTSPGGIPDRFGYARWCCRGDDFPVLQCLWPDRRGHFPTDPGFPESPRARQPSLAP